MASLYLPPPIVVHIFFSLSLIHLTNAHVNDIQVSIAVSVLNIRNKVSLVVEEVIFKYNIKRVNECKFFFTTKNCSLQLVLNIHDTHKRM